MIKKTVIINRAVPGSGKTTITNCVVNELRRNNINVAVHSTDEYFMIDGKYIFEIENLGNYHQSNLNEFINSINSGVDVIICDNTNIAPWQAEPYTTIARKSNYQVLIVTLDPRELEKHVESQRITEDKPDAHDVEENILKVMIEEYYLFDDLLNPYIFIDASKHMHYSWDEIKNKKIEVGIAKHFDCDHIIRILPDEYRDAQLHIGAKIIGIIRD